MIFRISKIISVFLLITVFSGFNNSFLIDCTSEVTSDYTRNNKLIGWSEDFRISEENNDYFCISTHVASIGSYVHVLWNANLNSTDNYRGLCYRRSVDSGNTWDDIFYLSNNYGCYSNNIAVSGANIHTVFTSQIPNASGVVYRRSIDNGETWEPINVNLTDFGGTDINVKIYENNIHIAWAYDWNGIWGILYLRSFDNGITWNQNRWLLKDSGTLLHPISLRLEVSENHIYLTYWGVNDTIELMSSQDNGDTWEHKVLHPGPNVGWPEIAGEENHVGVVWYNDSLPNNQLQFTKSDDYGKTWDEPRLINDQVEHLSVSSETPSMTMVDNIYYLVWGDYRDRPNFEIYFKKGINTGDNWSHDIKLTKKYPEGPDSWDPSIAVSGNNVYICWEDERVDRSQIFFKRTLPDFTTDNLSIASPEPLWANAPANFNLSLKNIGFADGYFVNVTVKYSDKIIFNGQIDKINLGTNENISFTWIPTQSGSIHLQVIIDDEKTNQEWNEDNNIFYKEFLIKENNAPVAKLEVDRTIAEVFKNINFDASESYDPDGFIASYYFDFGDGNNSGWIDNPIITYHYSQGGEYSSSIKVRDDRGGINSEIVEQDITIDWNPLPPVIIDIAFKPINPYCHENVTILVDATDLNSDPLEYIYTPETGTIYGTSENVTWQAPENPGTYEITTQVFDGQFYSSSWSINITVLKNQPPVIQNVNYTSNRIGLGESINITINATDLDGHILEYNYNTTAGELVENGTTITWYAPNEPGIHIILFNISDSHGGYDNKEVFMVVGEPEPNILIKSFKVTPEKIYKGEDSEILIELKFERNYINFITEVNVDISRLTGKSSQDLFDTGNNGDAVANDGIYSYRFLINIDNFTGEQEIQVNVKTTIPGFELNASTTIMIEEKSTDNPGSLINIFIGTTIILILIGIIILYLWIKKRKRKPPNKSS